ncbi:DUF6492 family protein [Muricoccus pecuniae]|uniref:Glycosyl transferase family 8 n=1 Tax=Muricoccus pecuniae TaxID=693023 RepID=A0A840XVU9_9PROT|nr:DUF6492 family protein [Roseomonas pecuniae]MBB5692878.1 hypothetical protein [Roseomonas pecuniae]
MNEAPAPLAAMLTLSARNNDIERAGILLDSFGRFCRDRLRLFVICPDDALGPVRDAYRGFASETLQPEFLADSAVLAPSVQADPAVRGTVRQMLAKLAFARHCPSPFYLTLDADVALVREWGVAEAVQGGRAAVQRKGIKPDDAWCNAAAELLGTPMDYDTTMDVTPSVLSTEGVGAMAAFLEARHGDWQRVLADQHRDGLRWTEYTLYWHFLRQAGLLERYHSLPERFRHFVPRSIWRAHGIEGWSLDRALAGPGHFVVLQSSTGLPVEEARAMLRM